MKKLIITLIVITASLSIQAQSTFKIKSSQPTTPLYVSVSNSNFLADENGSSITFFNMRADVYVVQFFADELSQRPLKTMEVVLQPNTKTTWVVGRNYQITSDVTAIEPQRTIHKEIPTAISDEEFKDIYEYVEKESFDARKFKAMSASAKYSYLNTDQVRKLLSLFSFDGNEKLSAAKMLFANTVDKYNYYKLADVFVFSSNKDKFLDFLNEI